MKYKYRVLYKPPIEEFIDDNPDTWRKVFLFSVYDCPSELDLSVTINQLIKNYNMKKEYILFQDLEKGEEYYWYKNEK